MDNYNQLGHNQSVEVNKQADKQHIIYVEKEQAPMTDHFKQEDIEPDVSPDSISAPAAQIESNFSQISHVPSSKFLFPVKVCRPPPAQNRRKVKVPPIQYRRGIKTIDPNVPIGVLLRKGYKFEIIKSNPQAAICDETSEQEQGQQLHKQCSNSYFQKKFQSPVSQPGPSIRTVPAHNNYDVKVPTILYGKRDEDSEQSLPPPNPLISEDPSVDVIDMELSQALKKSNVGFLRVFMPKPRVINRRWNYSVEENKQLPEPPGLSPAETMKIKKFLEDIDKEYNKEHADESRPDWLSGNSRHFIIQNFRENMHPSPKTILEISERTASKYHMVFQNYQRLRIHHGIRCEPNDNCERICRYFASGPPIQFNSRLRADEQSLLDRTLEEFCGKNIKMSTGQLHVFADQIGMSPHIIRTRFAYLRKKYLQNLKKTGEEKEVECRQLMLQFTANPFPDPAKYLVIAKAFNMNYDQVLQFFNSERQKHIKTHGAYQKVELFIDEQVSETLWDVVRQKKHLNLKVRTDLSEQLNISYKTVSFWVDKFASELRYGVENC